MITHLIVNYVNKHAPLNRNKPNTIGSVVKWYHVLKQRTGTGKKKALRLSQGIFIDHIFQAGGGGGSLNYYSCNLKIVIFGHGCNVFI